MNTKEVKFYLKCSKQVKLQVTITAGTQKSEYLREFLSFVQTLLLAGMGCIYLICKKRGLDQMTSKIPSSSENLLHPTTQHPFTHPSNHANIQVLSTLPDTVKTMISMPLQNSVALSSIFNSPIPVFRSFTLFTISDLYLTSHHVFPSVQPHHFSYLLFKFYLSFKLSSQTTSKQKLKISSFGLQRPLICFYYHILFPLA